MRHWLPLLVLLFLFTGCNTVSKEYASFSEIPKDDGVRSWLPDFFPTSAKNIDFTANQDLNDFSVYFTLNKPEKWLAGLEKETVSVKGLTFMQQKDQRIDSVVCLRSQYNQFENKITSYLLLGYIKDNNQFYMIKISKEK